MSSQEISEHFEFRLSESDDGSSYKSCDSNDLFRRWLLHGNVRCIDFHQAEAKEKIIYTQLGLGQSHSPRRLTSIIKFFGD